MDSFELNKIAGAVLGTLLFVMGANILSGILFTPSRRPPVDYILPVPQEQVAAAPAAAAPAEPLPVVLASADVGRGQAAAKKCVSCHTFEKGGPNRVGPNLYGVLARAKAAHAGFNYSAALKGKGGEWTFEDIDGFIANPRGYAPGTSMAFAGIAAQKERADILAYLRSLADNPVPLPTP